MVLATVRGRGSLLAHRAVLLVNGAARTSNVVAVLPHRLFSNMPPNPTVKSKERSEFREAKLPVDNIEFKETGLLTTIDRLSNIMFMAEIFRALWLSAEVRGVFPAASKDHHHALFLSSSPTYIRTALCTLYTKWVLPRLTRGCGLTGRRTKCIPQD